MPMSVRRRSALAATAAVTLALPVLATAPAEAAPNNNSSKKLQRAVSLQGVLRHLDAFQRIADQNDGNRAAGTPGYADSAEYVHRTLERLGYDPEYQDFSFERGFVRTPTTLERLTPEAGALEAVELTGSGNGDVTAAVTPVDVVEPPAEQPGSTSGCEPEDFAGFPAGNIALVQRGTCPFALKADNAQAAGAAAVIIYNEGQPGRTETLNGTLGEAGSDLAVVGVSYEAGRSLLAPGTTARVHVDLGVETVETRNVIAETATGDDSNVVMLGAHLDSVPEGPGYNDNGTGSAAILETAIQMRKVKPTNTVRFAWWGAEEEGLIGSTRYVAGLSEAEREDIALYLNFDMVGSPNYVRGVYDGDGSSFGLSGPEGSAQIEALFNQHFAGKDLPYTGTEFSGRSDYQAFINNGIPSGGLFTGAEVLKTEEQAAVFGGVAGAAYDPCYHQACDSADPVADGGDAAVYGQLEDLRGNVNLVALDTNSDAIAHAAITYAFDTSSLSEPVPPGDSGGDENGGGGLAGKKAHDHEGVPQ